MESLDAIVGNTEQIYWWADFHINISMVVVQLSSTCGLFASEVNERHGCLG
jgi:hypothetical protein